ncbi:MAG: hypothetical protein EOP84_23415 [Verrucomicrobiaceae bacterium]|nr:MAG: hypothetical protein EOP84_23415 [Verrucomicrobiaceae bacterium]
MGKVSKVSLMSRSMKKITMDDLAYLAEVADEDLNDFISRHPRYFGLKANRFCVALCQGAALHYLNGTNGVKDLDVWTFYAHDGRNPSYPYRTRRERLVERGTFAKPARKIDLLGRTLDASKGEDPVRAVQRYVATHASASAKALAKKAVVAILPARLRGTIIWPVSAQEQGLGPRRR